MEEIKEKPKDPNDPENVNGKLYSCISRLLDNFDAMTVREQVAAVAAVARIQVLFIKIREDKEDERPANVGTAVKKYERAFKTNAANKRKRVTGTADAILHDFDREDELQY